MSQTSHRIEVNPWHIIDAFQGIRAEISPDTIVEKGFQSIVKGAKYTLNYFHNYYKALMLCKL